MKPQAKGRQPTMLRLVFTSLTLLAAMISAGAHAAPVTLNLKDADINALVASISEITGRNFIVDPRVKGRVSVISSRPMEEEEIYKVFLSVLAVHGFAAIPGQNVTKIVPAAGAKQENIPTLDEINGGGEDQMVTRVIQVENVSAAQIVPILRPLIPPQGHLAAYSPTNVLIISDLAGNVERIANIIRRIDLASNEEIEIVPLQHASASEVVRILNSLEQKSGDPGPVAGAAPINAPARLVADERTNSVLMSGDRSSRLRLRTLIVHLDTPLKTNGNTQVIYLRYAKAADLVPILQGVSKNLDAEQNAQAQDAGPREPVDIQADESTNALVVTAPPDKLGSLKAVISQLDIRRAQVLVEAAIAEISSDKTAELGVQWLVDGTDGGSLVGFTNFGENTSLGGIASAIISDTLPSPANIPRGLVAAAGDLDGSVRFGALVNALASDAGTNLLSTPTLVTMDNEEAEIVVGQNVPFVTGNFTTNTSGGDTVGNPFQTIERQDVGLTLRVTPQINEGNAVQLEIYQEVSAVVPTATVLAQGPTTNKRTIRTNVLVEDGQILVLGGLIDDNLNETVQKVPGLGDIPYVGNLFRYRQSSKNKRNLMVFLHPVILRDSQEGALRTNDKYSYIRQQQFAARQRGVALLSDEQTPLMPPSEQVQRQGSFIIPEAQAALPIRTAPPVPVPGQSGFSSK